MNLCNITQEGEWRWLGWCLHCSLHAYDTNVTLFFFLVLGTNLCWCFKENWFCSEQHWELFTFSLWLLIYFGKRPDRGKTTGLLLCQIHMKLLNLKRLVSISSLTTFFILSFSEFIWSRNASWLSRLVDLKHKCNYSH